MNLHANCRIISDHNSILTVAVCVGDKIAHIFAGEKYMILHKLDW